MNILRLVFAHMLFHWQRTLLLTGCLTITLLLPMLIPQLVTRIQEELYSRSEAIPLVLGSKQCSPLDLSLHGLYFRSEEIPTITFGKWESTAQRFPENVLPLHARFHVRDQQNHTYPIVGTHLEYFDLRSLQLAEGERFATLGDCVLGANVAKQLDVHVGDTVVSSPKSIVSLAAAYPVQLNIVGVLQPSQSVDDEIVLTDVKTAWVLENLGHGHQNVDNSNDPNLVLERNESQTVASAAVVPYTVIDSSNLASFHFHGDVQTFPITAILVLSHQQRELDLVAGLAERDPDLQAVDCKQEVDRLLAVIFQVQWLLMAVVVIVGLATLLLFAMVIGLSVQIRRQEMLTMFKLGGSKWLTFQLHACEIICILLVSLLLAGISSSIIQGSLGSNWLHTLV